MNNNNRGGKREGSGRKKGTNEPHLVRCHPEVIWMVRIYAKEQSEQYLEQLKNLSK